MKKILLVLVLSSSIFGMQKDLRATDFNDRVLQEASSRLRNFNEQYRQNVHLNNDGAIFWKIHLEQDSGLHLFHYVQEVANRKRLFLNREGRFKIEDAVQNINDSIVKLKGGSIRGLVQNPFMDSLYKIDESDIFLYLRMAIVLADRQDILDHSSLEDVYNCGKQELQIFYDYFYEVTGVLYKNTYVDKITEDQVQKLKKHVPFLKRARHRMIFASVEDSAYLFNLDLLNSKFKDALSFVDRAESYLDHKKRELEELEKWTNSQEKKNLDIERKARKLLNLIEKNNWDEFKIEELEALVDGIKFVVSYCDQHGYGYYSENCKSDLPNLIEKLEQAKT